MQTQDIKTGQEPYKTDDQISLIICGSNGNLLNFFNQFISID